MLLDIAARFESYSNTWNATLFVKNVTDEFYSNGIGLLLSVFLPNGYIHRYLKQAERTYGLEMRYRW